MNFKTLIFMLVAAISLSACISAPKNTDTALATERNVPISLERMDTQFLYLAAQQALDHGKPVLATRFLQTLVNKEPQALEPRFELVELYLVAGQSKQAQEAKRLMEDIPKETVGSFEADHLERYQMLYARALIANGEGLQAASLLQSLLQKRPDNLQIRLLLVKMKALDGDVKGAHLLLDEGMGKSDDLRLQQTKVQLYVKENQFEKADQLLANMQKKYTEHENIVLDRARLAEQQGDAVKAERLLKGFINSHQETAVQSYSLLASLFVRQNRFDEAIAIYKSMLPLTAGSVDVYAALGKVYYQQKAYPEAAEMFELALQRLIPSVEADELTQAQAEANFYLGASLEASQEWQKAVPHYEKLNVKHAFYLDAQLRLASIDLSQQQYDKAEQRLKSLSKSFASQISVYEMLSSLRLQQKKYKVLLQETEKALDLGFSQVILFNRAVAFESLKKFDLLDETLSLLLREEPENAEALNFYGYSLADRGERLEEAQSMILRALKLRPNDGYYLDSLAWVYFKQQQYQKAIQYQSRAVELIPADPVMQEHLGDMHWAANNYEAARKYWAKALELKHVSPKMLQEKIKRGLQ